jgi:hypothetical protein
MQGPLLRTTTGFLSLLLAHSAAFALDVNIHGFLNAGLATHDAKKTTLTSLNATSTGFNTTQESPIYDGMVGRRPDADYLTSLGLQLDSPISDHLGITAQLVSDGGQTNDYKISSEWAFAKYRFNDNWSIRAGRLRNPAFLLSEYLKVGYATPWAQPPREVYWQMPGGLQNISGADVTYSNTLLNQDLNVTVFTGAVNTTFSLSGSPVSIKGNNALGTNITFGNEALTFRAGYETAEFKVNGSALQFIRDTLANPALVGVSNLESAKRFDIDQKRGKFFGVGYRLEWNNIYSLAEYTRREFAGWMADTYGYYGTIGYRFGNFLPTLTYSRFRTTDQNERDALLPESMITNLAATQATAQAGVTQLQGLVDLIILNGGAPVGGRGGPFAATTLTEAHALLAQAQAGLSGTTALLPPLTAARKGLLDFYKGEQDSVTYALRYDVMKNTAIKASVQHIMVRNGSQGVFSNTPAKSGVNLYSLALNVVF